MKWVYVDTAMALIWRRCPATVSRAILEVEGEEQGVYRRTRLEVGYTRSVTDTGQRILARDWDDWDDWDRRREDIRGNEKQVRLE